jgi:hypothetical protein
MLGYQMHNLLAVAGNQQAQNTLRTFPVGKYDNKLHAVQLNL